jgi:putative acetyltransferase
MPATDSSSCEITHATSGDLERMLTVWESAVRATHHFLDESHIGTFAPLVREEVGTFTPIHCLRDAAGQVCAFMGVANAKIEMLFVAPECHGQGAGSRLVEFAIRSLGARFVDVNEQNPQAVGFYERMGFRTVRRSEFDPFGNPFPLLHMSLVVA